MSYKTLTLLFLWFSIPLYGMHIVIPKDQLSHEQQAALIRVASTESLPEKERSSSWWCCCRSRRAKRVTVAVMLAGTLVALTPVVTDVIKGIKTVERVEGTVDRIETALAKAEQDLADIRDFLNRTHSKQP